MSLAKPRVSWQRRRAKSSECLRATCAWVGKTGKYPATSDILSVRAQKSLLPVIIQKALCVALFTQAPVLAWASQSRRSSNSKTGDTQLRAHAWPVSTLWWTRLEHSLQASVRESKDEIQASPGCCRPARTVRSIGHLAINLRFTLDYRNGSSEELAIPRRLHHHRTRTHHQRTQCINLQRGHWTRHRVWPLGRSAKPAELGIPRLSQGTHDQSCQARTLQAQQAWDLRRVWLHLMLLTSMELARCHPVQMYKPISPIVGSTPFSSRP